MPDNKSVLDFELPPLPDLPKLPPNQGGTAPKSDVPPIPRAPKAYSGEDGLPPLPVRKKEEKKADEDNTPKTPLDEGYVPKTEMDNVVKRVTSMKDDDFGVAPKPKKEPEPEPEKPYEEGDMIFYDDYDPSTLDASSIKLEDTSAKPKKMKLAPMSSAKQDSARVLREQIKMGDLMMDTEAPEISEMTAEFTDGKGKKRNLAEQDRLDDREKQELVRSMKENLSHVPEGYNARASKRMANKLMEEQNLKLARKGMLLSFLPIALGLIASFLCIITPLDWGNHMYITYTGYLGVAGAVLLLIKSKQMKSFGIIIYAICCLVYVIPALVLYMLAMMNDSPEATEMSHIIAAGGASVCMICALLVLIKSKAVDMYYSTSFKRKKD